MGADDGGFGEGIATSDGDPRVLLGLNAVLSTLLGWTLIGGLSFLDVVAFSIINVATAAIIVFTLTYAVTMT